MKTLIENLCCAYTGLALSVALLTMPLTADEKPVEGPAEEAEEAAPGEEVEITEEDELAADSLAPTDTEVGPGSVLFSEESSEINMGMGTMYNSLGQHGLAAQAFSKLLDQLPDNAQAHYGLGVAFLGMGNRPAATAQYNILTSLSPALANKLLEALNL